jgi:hypothetical protein
VSHGEIFLPRMSMYPYLVESGTYCNHSATSMIAVQVALLLQVGKEALPPDIVPMIIRQGTPKNRRESGVLIRIITGCHYRNNNI